MQKELEEIIKNGKYRVGDTVVVNYLDMPDYVSFGSGTNGWESAWFIVQNLDPLKVEYSYSIRRVKDERLL